MAVRRRKADPTVGTSTRERAFLTIHARVLVVIARGPDRRLREMAEECRTSERTVWNIVRDLEQAGYVRRRRDGGTVRYTVDLDRSLHPPAEAHLRVRHLVTLMAQAAEPGDRQAPPSPHG
ncbi:MULTISPECIES: helix-turn-helix transcriptional regulator [unclassified Streptomyces]|uniref:helix-turn-helix transcriptional regulator n=1 Tax=unclassified Streptomyces TaxID=2593676 RepID=UPI0036F8DAAA